MRPTCIISLLANTDSSFLNNLHRLHATLVVISPNFTTVVQIRHDKSRLIEYNEYNANIE